MKPRYLIPSMIFALLVAYPLSAGPVAFWVFRVQKLERAPHWIEVVYGPLQVAYDHSQFVRDAMETYGKILGLDD